MFCQPRVPFPRRPRLHLLLWSDLVGCLTRAHTRKDQLCLGTWLPGMALEVGFSAPCDWRSTLRSRAGSLYKSTDIWTMDGSNQVFGEDNFIGVGSCLALKFWLPWSIKAGLSVPKKAYWKHSCEQCLDCPKFRHTLTLDSTLAPVWGSGHRMDSGTRCGWRMNEMWC